jgi:NADPH:quinone reductase-like Zn-dependent oxidoreductase
MRAVRLHSPGGIDGLATEEVETPSTGAGEVLVRVRAAAITRDELDWPTDRLPAIPSYELSGLVAAVSPDVEGVTVGEAVCALTPFDRNGVAADYAAVPADVLAPKPRTLDHVEAAAVPLAALSAWEGLFDRGGLEPGRRVLILGAAGGVGHFATQLASWRGAHVVGVAGPARLDRVRRLGADEAIDSTGTELESLEPVDLVFDTVGGDLAARSIAAIRDGGRFVSVAEEPPADTQVSAEYFVVQPSRARLTELSGLLDSGAVRPEIDSVFGLADARKAFTRSLARGKTGKVVLRVSDE